MHRCPHVVGSSSGKRMWQYQSSVGSSYAHSPIITDQLVLAPTADTVFGFSANEHKRVVKSLPSHRAEPYTIEIDGKRIKSSMVIRDNVPYVPIRDIYSAYGYRCQYTSNGLWVDTHNVIPAEYKYGLVPLSVAQIMTTHKMHWRSWLGEIKPTRIPILHHGRYYFAIDRMPMAQGMMIWKPETKRIVLVGFRSPTVRSINGLPQK